MASQISLRFPDRLTLTSSFIFEKLKSNWLDTLLEIQITRKEKTKSHQKSIDYLEAQELLIIKWSYYENG